MIPACVPLGPWRAVSNAPTGRIDAGQSNRFRVTRVSALP